MKKIFLLLAAVLLVGILAGCDDGKPASSTDAGSDGAVNEGVYTFIANEVEVTPNVKSDPIIPRLGEQIDPVRESDSCAFIGGTDKTYFFSGYELSTYPDDKNVYYVLSVLLLDDSVSTPEGISIGDAFDDVTAKYGTGYTERNDVYTYTKGMTSLKFTVKDGEVTLIRYLSTILKEEDID